VEKYYAWICPVCKDDSCSDPMRIVGTVCRSGHHVILSDYVKPNGLREAIYNKELQESLKLQQTRSEQ
jgi:hypothetical protein